MATKYSNPTVESMVGDSGDEEREDGVEIEEPDNEDVHRHPKTSHEPVMIVNSKSNRRRKKHREANKPKAKPKNAEGKKYSVAPAREHSNEGPRYRHRRSLSRRSSSSTSSSEDDEPILDHRAVLAAARAKLTSPSMLSAMTTQTTATNTSSSSSGSSSTVTQMSMSKRPVPGKKSTQEPPLSPAVPDPPHEFTFPSDNGNSSMQEGSQDIHDKHQQGEVEEHDTDHQEEEDEGSSDDQTPPWAQKQIEAPPVDLRTHLPEGRASSTSSASSSFHGDDFSDPPIDNDTDRSTSPERSIKGHDINEPKPLETIPEIPEFVGALASPPPTPTRTPADHSSSRMAAQMAAARQQQNQYTAMNQFGTPHMPRGNAQLPVVRSSALGTRYPQTMAQRPLPRAEKLPVTGYELLASQLSTRADSEGDGRIKPLYRKFEALNHRLLLHLQDELSELEEQLHRLDHADTQSRRTDRHIVPASRRAAALAGGDLQWHKTDILGRIGFKLGQYNQALASFNETQLLSPPTIDDIDQYREYLEMEQPIHESETHFLDPEDDLVSLSSQQVSRKAHRHHLQTSESPSSGDISSSELSSRKSTPPQSIKAVKEVKTSKGSRSVQSLFTTYVAAITTIVLLPIITFTIIPNFLGRLIVAILIALSTTSALVQAQILDKELLFRQESTLCIGIYAGAMALIAGIMS